MDRDHSIRAGLVNSYVDSVELGLARGESPNALFSAEATALQYVAGANSLYGRGNQVPGYDSFKNKLLIMRTLLAHGANPNLLAPESRISALEIASRSNNPDAVRMLIEAGATIPAQVAPGSLIDIYVNHRDQFPPPTLLPPPPLRSPFDIDIPSDRIDPVTFEEFTEGEKVGCFPNSNPRIRTMCHKLESIQSLIATSRDPGRVTNPETAEVVPVSSIIYGVAHIVPPLGGKRRTRRKHRKHKSKTGKRKARRGGGNAPSGLFGELRPIPPEGIVDTPDEDLYVAVHDSNLAGVRAALAAGASPNTPSTHGNQVLADASAQGDLEIVRELLNHGADINHRNDTGYTALANANVTGGDLNSVIPVVRELISRGAILPRTINPRSPVDIVLKSRASVNQLQTMHTISSLGANPAFPLPPDVTEHIGTNYLGAPPVRLRPVLPKPAGRRKTRKQKRKTAKRKSRK
jgi:ankyrin repeat protein